MRRDTARPHFEIAARAAGAPAPERSASRVAVALPAASLPLMALGILLLLGTLLMMPRPAAAEPASLDPSVSVTAALLAVSLDRPVAAPRSDATVGELLVVPVSALYLSDAEFADETLAAAVALGTDPDLAPVSKFRKRSIDLFRTEHEVEIGQREMLVRLRVRAKTRRAMSVEVRF